jgi:hypothetical protein
LYTAASSSEIGSPEASYPLSIKMDEERQKTLELLVDLARTNDPASCWDQDRARTLLRNQSTPEELRQIGVDPVLIDHIFAREK